VRTRPFVILICLGLWCASSPHCDRRRVSVFEEEFGEGEADGASVPVVVNGARRRVTDPDWRNRPLSPGYLGRQLVNRVQQVRDGCLLRMRVG